ncbi:MAG: hypothetical protein KTR22_00070 [Flavobacteriaceae bacterium]|nr:hypothetical protein [Flavobacteriaceae bacterium]
MDLNKNNSLILIILSLIFLLPNIGCLLVAHFAMDAAPTILYIVPSVMIILSMIGLIYGLALRKRPDK